MAEDDALSSKTPRTSKQGSAHPPAAQEVGALQLRAGGCAAAARTARPIPGAAGAASVLSCLHQGFVSHLPFYVPCVLTFSFFHVCCCSLLYWGCSTVSRHVSNPRPFIRSLFAVQEYIEEGTRLYRTTWKDYVCCCCRPGPNAVLNPHEAVTLLNDKQVCPHAHL
jgi:hypothetical protein